MLPARLLTRNVAYTLSHSSRTLSVFPQALPTEALLLREHIVADNVSTGSRYTRLNA